MAYMHVSHEWSYCLNLGLWITLPQEFLVFIAYLVLMAYLVVMAYLVPRIPCDHGLHGVHDLPCVHGIPFPMNSL